jgi:hypothetical protein
MERFFFKRKLLKATLPQDDPDPAARNAALARQRERYEYDYHPVFIPKEDPAFEGVRFPVLANVPSEEGLSVKYITSRVFHSRGLITNTLLMRARKLFDPLDKLEDYSDVFIRLPSPDIVKSFMVCCDAPATPNQRHSAMASPVWRLRGFGVQLQ